MLALVRDKVVAELRAALERVPGMQLGVLFGSVARDEAWEESDVDVAVLGEGLDIPGLSEELQRALGAEVDVVNLVDDLPVTLVQEILADGICVFESEPGRYAAWLSPALWKVEMDAPLLARGARAFLARVAERGLP